MSERWEPDEHLVPAAKAGRLTMADLAAPDRAWVVAHLTAEGMTAAETADRLGCSLRLVKAVRAEPMTAVCALLAAETAAFDGELRLVRSELAMASSANERAQRDLSMARAQLARLLYTGACGAGHEWTPYNTYLRRDGKRHCRECARLRAQRYRDEKRGRAVGGQHDPVGSDPQPVAP